LRCPGRVLSYGYSYPGGLAKYTFELSIEMLSDAVIHCIFFYKLGKTKLAYLVYILPSVDSPVLSFY
jgi:hypothetical protein